VLRWKNVQQLYGRKPHMPHVRHKQGKRSV